MYSKQWIGKDRRIWGTEYNFVKNLFSNAVVIQTHK